MGLYSVWRLAGEGDGRRGEERLLPIMAGAAPTAVPGARETCLRYTSLGDIEINMELPLERTRTEASASMAWSCMGAC